jgi:hypothetical protein
MSVCAIGIKKAAAVAVANLLDRIALAHAFPDDLSPTLYGGGGGLYAETSILASTGKRILDFDQSWLDLIFMMWIVFLHLVLAYMLWERYGPRFACRRRRPDMDAGIQVNLLPNSANLTVEGLRREAKFMGLRINGNRSELETRTNNELLHRSDDLH